MSLAQAFAGIAGGFSAAFGVPYHAGFVIRHMDAVYDDGGSIITPGGVDRASCQVQIDSVDERMRPEAWTDKDYRFLILSASLGEGDQSGAIPDLDTDATIEVPAGDMAGSWMVSSLQKDPAGIGYVGRGRRV